VHQVPTLGLHQVATPVPKIGGQVLLFQLVQQVGGVRIAGALAGYQIVFHLLSIILSAAKDLVTPAPPGLVIADKSDRDKMLPSPAGPVR